MIITATGHRPKYFTDKDTNWIQQREIKLKHWLIEQSPTVCITGMAIGWDTIFANIVLELEIPLYCYLPFDGQSTSWSIQNQAEYQKILKRATKIEVCSQEYYPRCFLKRDEMMVRDCDQVATLLDPAVNYGGTYYTVSYAKKLNKSVKNFW